MKIITDSVEMVDTAKLVIHPRNPNQGDVGAIVESIKAHGFYGAVVAQRSTRHILAGNHRVQAANLCGIQKVPVMWVDCDERTALKILLADNRTAELAIRDQEILTSLLHELVADEDIYGTGYDSQDLDALLAELEAPMNLDIADDKPPRECPSCGFPL